MIRRNVELEARLIDDLLDLTRVARGKLELHREVADVPQVAGARPAQICRGEIAGQGPAPGAGARGRRTTTSGPTRPGSARSSGT